ncbi:sulfotransferase family protein [Pseudomonas sp. DTU_2021_1001937_2_SI_NGA_ILE_001]|uniref:sulfotransferase family protein n=1 Tax=Pseudomonas sp. DTU_2021_1001937_2_SI_NGA_ILE_001 TaxID=3077589 RepID=UPI0028FC0F70|nr:sulfotransferase family protein [Pseudomonas sp. DTU_2021_1001937_2_SI_NGA_ILE_001]WNW12300.1 sulfotransferase family protein [Pseudomonas sp. DTU_2021_1001937_2_SI_NGA_ILE_001]
MDSLKGWLPIRIWQQDGQWWVDWCWFGQQPLEQPFFRDAVEQALRLPFNQALRRQTPLQVLCEWPVADIQPVAFIHHASRCGSTLVCQMLACLDAFIVISEAPPVDTLLRANMAPVLRQAALRGLLAAYGQARRGTERALVIKHDAWNIGELPLMREVFPQVPWLFIYRDPLEIAVSHRRAPGMHMVPGMIGASCLDDPAHDPACREDFIAGRVGRTLALGLEQCRKAGGWALDYRDVLEAMHGPLGDLLGLTAQERETARAASRQHAKQPAQVFVGDSQRKQEEASELLKARVEHWARAAYSGLQQLGRGRAPDH